MEGGTRWTVLALVVAARMLGGDEAWAGGPERRRGGEGGLEPVSRRIVVSLADRKLAVVENERVLRVFDVAVGAPVSPSPTGIFVVTDRIPDPTYYTRGKVIPPGRQNPLGTRWIGLSAKGYGIHGTDRPDSIGHARSHGCIRLHNREVEALFDLIASGDRVEFLAERTPETAALFATTGAVPTASRHVVLAAGNVLPARTIGSPVLSMSF